MFWQLYFKNIKLTSFIGLKHRKTLGASLGLSELSHQDERQQILAWRSLTTVQRTLSISMISLWILSCSNWPSAGGFTGTSVLKVLVRYYLEVFYPSLILNFSDTRYLTYLRQIRKLCFIDHQNNSSSNIKGRKPVWKLLKK